MQVCEALPNLTEHDRERLETLGEGVRARGPFGWALEDGSFRIDGVPGGPCALVAFESGYLFAVSEPFEIEPGRAIDGGTLVLRGPGRENRIEGVVFDATGAAAGSRPVELWQPGVARNVEPTVQRASSDAEGRFRFVVPRTSSYHVILLDEMHSEEIARVENVSPGDDPVVLRIPPERFVEIHVSAEDGEPLEGAWCSMADADGHGMRTRPEQTEPGVLRLEVVGRPFYLWVNAPGYEGQRTEVLIPEEIPERLDFALEPERGARIHGVVTTSGSPVPGARLLAYPEVEGAHRLNTGFATRLEVQAAVSSTPTGEDGVYELLIKRDSDLILLVFHDDRVALELGPIVASPSDADRELDLALPASGSIEGRALLAVGRDPIGLVVGASRGDGEVRSVKLSADAAFRFDTLAPGRWQVRLVTENTHLLRDRRTYATSEDPTWDVDLEPAEAARFDIDLRHEVGCRLRGRVSLVPDGPTDWRFGLRGSWDDVDADGRFAAEVFGPGEAWLNLWGSYGPSISLRVFERLDLVPGETEWKLDPPTAQLELTGVPAFESDVDRREWEPELLRLQWTDTEGRRATVRVSSHGGGPLHLRGLPIGAWSVEARYSQDGSPESNWRTVVADLVLTAGEHRTIELP